MEVKGSAGILRAVQSMSQRQGQMAERWGQRGKRMGPERDA